MPQDARGRDDGGARQVGPSLALLSREVPVPRADLDLALARQPRVTLGTAAAARVDDDGAGLEEVEENAFFQKLLVDPAGRGHDFEHDSAANATPLENPSGAGEILHPAVGARADEP